MLLHAMSAATISRGSNSCKHVTCLYVVAMLAEMIGSVTTTTYERAMHVLLAAYQRSFK